MILKAAGKMVLHFCFFYLLFGNVAIFGFNFKINTKRVYIYNLFLGSPSAVEMSKALKMSSRERLKYSFDVAEQEFGVPSLLDPSGIRS